MTINVFYSLIAGCYSSGMIGHQSVTSTSSKSWFCFCRRPLRFFVFGTPCGSGSPNTLPTFKMQGGTCVFAAPLNLVWMQPYRRADRPTDLKTDLQTCWLTDQSAYWPADHSLLNCSDQEPATSRIQLSLVIWLVSAHPAVLKFWTTLDRVRMPDFACFWGIWTGIRPVYFLHVNHYVCRETDIQACRIEAAVGQRHFHIPGLPVDVEPFRGGS